MAHRLVPVSTAHKAFNKNGKKVIAASAATRKNDPMGGAGGRAPGGRPPYELPNGQWCSKGTCHFTHDKVNPSGPCHRDPRCSGRRSPRRSSKKTSRKDQECTRKQRKAQEHRLLADLV
eukprot:4386300-Pleurochrysis_carterae.AAC.2